MKRDTRNYSSAFNPSRLAPVEHTHAHAQGYTLMETDAMCTGAVGSLSQRPGSVLNALNIKFVESLEKASRSVVNWWIAGLKRGVRLQRACLSTAAFTFLLVTGKNLLWLSRK